MKDLENLRAESFSRPVSNRPSMNPQQMLKEQAEQLKWNLEKNSSPHLQRSSFSPRKTTFHQESTSQRESPMELNAFDLIKKSKQVQAGNRLTCHVRQD